HTHHISPDLLSFILSTILPRPPPSTLLPYTTLFRSRLRYVVDAGVRDPEKLNHGEHERSKEKHLDPCERVRANREDHHAHARAEDRKSTRLNSSHLVISYAVFCLKKKKEQN